MQTISELMSRDVRVVAPNESVLHAAQVMKECDVGALPVCNGRKLVGILTDRDTPRRGVAEARQADATPIDAVMTQRVEWCYENDSIEHALQHMREQQIRRLPIVDNEKNLVGIVSLGDVALDQQTHDVAEALSGISMPGGAHAGSGGTAARHH